MYASHARLAPPLVGSRCLRAQPSSWRPVLPRRLAGAISLSSRARVSAPAVGAVRSLDGIKSGGIVETDKLPFDLRDRTMRAVDSYGKRATVGDVASKAGLKLEEAERALQALAADAGGFLEVSDDGDVLYVLPKDYRSKISSKSIRMKFEPLLEWSKGAIEFLIRVSFGTALVASIAIVFAAIAAVMCSASESDDGRKRRDRGVSFGGGSSRSYSFTILPSDLFWYWDPYYYHRRQTKVADKMNFLESVFSFVFGDGDPNQAMEKERWKLIGQYISSNGGVVTAEELAPFLDVAPIERAKDDESYILPVLLQFGGQPEVDDEGNILYLFPSLQRTSSDSSFGRKEHVAVRRPKFDYVANIFEEKRWLFSKADASAKALIIGLGVLNLFGVNTLGIMLRSTAGASESFISFVRNIFPFLQIYAISFFAIPLARWFLNLKNNARIAKRNQARRQWAQLLASPTPSLRRKLLSARELSRTTVIGPDRIVYRTDKDLMGQDTDAGEWNMRFRNLEK